MSGCRLILPEAVRPVRAVTIEPVSRPVREVVVLLPGRHSVPEEFIKEDLVNRIQARRPYARILLPDLHLRYYMERLADVCLYEEVVAPARRENLPVTLVGVSMGGLGALITALRHPQDVQELWLLAPYLGDDALIREIESAGGLSQWESKVTEARTKDESMRLLWGQLQERWLKAGGPPLKVALAVGKKDRHLQSNRLFAYTLLGPGQYREVEGGHDWPAWREGTDWFLK